MKDVTKYLIANSRHEFLNEKEHFEEAFAQISAFLKRVSVRKSRTAAESGRGKKKKFPKKFAAAGLTNFARAIIMIAENRIPGK